MRMIPRPQITVLGIHKFEFEDSSVEGHLATICPPYDAKMRADVREMLESTVTDYLAGSDPRDPRCSAIFADVHGFPPMLIQVGENEILYDDATRIRDAATAAGVDVSFESWRHGIHVWPVFISAGLPESAAAVERLAAFFKA